MNLTDFYKTYPDEEASERALRKYRECNTLYCLPGMRRSAPQLESEPQVLDMYGLRS